MKPVKIPPSELATYPLPGFLEGRLSHSVYVKWLNNKADTLLKRDKKRGKPYAAAATKCVYKDKIHEAVIHGGERDPFTGEALCWELISTWDTKRKQPDGYKRKFFLMPTVDHVTEDSLGFEICSWRTNGSKSDLKPQEFVELCGMVTRYRGENGAR
jgi:hypothetical protein